MLTILRQILFGDTKDETDFYQKLVSQPVAYLFHAVFVVSSQRSQKSTTNPRVAEISIDNYILLVF